MKPSVSFTARLLFPGLYVCHQIEMQTVHLWCSCSVFPVADTLRLCHHKRCKSLSCEGSPIVTMETFFLIEYAVTVFTPIID